VWRTYHGRDGANQEHNTSDASSQQRDRPARQTQALEDLTRIVDDGIDSTPLLPEHDHPSDADALEVVLGPEAHDVLRELLSETTVALLSELREVAHESLLFEECLGLDLKVLGVDIVMVIGEVAHPG
jgi:hypothetical protein